MKIRRDGIGILSRKRLSKIQIKMTHPINSKGPFKEITSLSPLQFQKRLRLYEAERLMLIEGKDAGTAALSVGYESVSQFTREYKRQFGEPPHRDVARKKS